MQCLKINFLARQGQIHSLQFRTKMIPILSSKQTCWPGEERKIGEEKKDLWTVIRDLWIASPTHRRVFEVSPLPPLEQTTFRPHILSFSDLWLRGQFKLNSCIYRGKRIISVWSLVGFHSLHLMLLLFKSDWRGVLTNRWRLRPTSFCRPT